VTSKVDYKIEGLICDVRRKHPSWGPEKIVAKLTRDYPRKKWPSLSTVGRVLKRNKLVAPKKRRLKTPPYTRPFGDITACNQVWCIDFKGQFKTRDGHMIYPLTITDAHSRYILCCETLLSPDTYNVARVVERIFKKYGCPEANRSANGSPFASTGAGGLTELSKWWARLGIRHERIEPGKPAQNGRHERMYRTLKQETCLRPALTPHGQKMKFNRFVTSFNNERPHQALQNKVPNEVYQPSMKKYRRGEYENVSPKFGLDHCFVGRNGFTNINGKKIKIGKVLANEMIDIYPIKKSLSLLAFGPVPIGIYNEKTKRFIPNKATAKRKSVSDVVNMKCQ
jgi:transposase InsO family protein